MRMNLKPIYFDSSIHDEDKKKIKDNFDNFVCSIVSNLCTRGNKNGNRVDYAFNIEQVNEVIKLKNERYPDVVLNYRYDEEQKLYEMWREGTNEDKRYKSN